MDGAEAVALSFGKDPAEFRDRPPPERYTRRLDLFKRAVAVGRLVILTFLKSLSRGDVTSVSGFPYS